MPVGRGVGERPRIPARGAARPGPGRVGGDGEAVVVGAGPQDAEEEPGRSDPPPPPEIPADPETAPGALARGFPGLREVRAPPADPGRRVAAGHDPALVGARQRGVDARGQRARPPGPGPPPSAQEDATPPVRGGDVEGAVEGPRAQGRKETNEVPVDERLDRNSP